MNRSDDWKQPWLRYFMGMSLLQEPGEGLRRQGLVELAWLPAQHGSEHPYLAGAAMAIMARELAKQGEQDAAARLEKELRTRFANHPACRLGGIAAQNEAQEDLTR
ncbi:MAG: hypothetical protein VX527_09320 [Planctomycetota bacterium]|nr:hypothetical protein [Planctomycetota bacterium]